MSSSPQTTQRPPPYSMLLGIGRVGAPGAAGTVWTRSGPANLGHTRLPIEIGGSGLLEPTRIDLAGVVGVTVVGELALVTATSTRAALRSTDLAWAAEVLFVLSFRLGPIRNRCRAVREVIVQDHVGGGIVNYG